MLERFYSISVYPTCRCKTKRRRTARWYNVDKLISAGCGPNRDEIIIEIDEDDAAKSILSKWIVPGTHFYFIATVFNWPHRYGCESHARTTETFRADGRIQFDQIEEFEDFRAMLFFSTLNVESIGRRWSFPCHRGVYVYFDTLFTRQLTVSISQ